MKIVIDKENIEERYNYHRVKFEVYGNKESQLVYYHLGDILDRAESLSDVVKPLLEDAYEQGFRHGDKGDYGYGRETISSLLEKINQ